MDEMDAWATFFATGKVLDYLTYKSIQDSKKDFDGRNTPEDIDEAENGRTDNQGTEYR